MPIAHLPTSEQPDCGFKTATGEWFEPTKSQIELNNAYYAHIHSPSNLHDPDNCGFMGWKGTCGTLTPINHGSPTSFKNFVANQDQSGGLTHTLALQKTQGEYSQIQCEHGEIHHIITKNEPAPAPACLLYTSPSPRDATLSRMPSSA